MVACNAPQRHLQERDVPFKHTFRVFDWWLPLIVILMDLPWCCFLEVFFSFIHGYSATEELRPGPDPGCCLFGGLGEVTGPCRELPCWGATSSWQRDGGGWTEDWRALMDETLWNVSLIWGRAVMNSAMEGWLLIKPLSQVTSMVAWQYWVVQLSRLEGNNALQKVTSNVLFAVRLCRGCSNVCIDLW